MAIKSENNETITCYRESALMKEMSESITVITNMLFIHTPPMYLFLYFYVNTTILWS